MKSYQITKPEDFNLDNTLIDIGFLLENIGAKKYLSYLKVFAGASSEYKHEFLDFCKLIFLRLEADELRVFLSNMYHHILSCIDGIMISGNQFYIDTYSCKKPELLCGQGREAAIIYLWHEGKKILKLKRIKINVDKVVV